MFYTATKSLAKQLDPEGNLIPVRCPVDHSHFTLLCLVQKKSKNSRLQKQRYYKTDYKLRDVLLPGEHTSQLDIYDSDPFTIVDNVDGKLWGDVNVATDLATMQLTSSASLSHARSVKVKKRQLSSQVLDSLHGNSKINLDHLLIQQSKEFQKDLYVITETVEAMEEAEFKENNKIEGSFLTEFHVKLRFKGLKDSGRAVTIPKDCTLAYRVKRLLIRQGSLRISIFPDDRSSTFVFGGMSDIRLPPRVERIMRSLPAPPPPGFGGMSNIRFPSWVESQIRYSAPPVRIPVEIERENQLMETENECAPLLLLSTDLRGKLLNGFLAIMRNNDLLQEFELQLEQALEEINPMKLKTGRPELQELVDNLQDSTGAIYREIAESVLYFLQALDELSEFEFLFLEESVERKIVSKQTALVRRILEKPFSNAEESVTIDSQKVSPFIEDELDITEALIKLCGVTVQRSGDCLTMTSNPEAFLALSVLYVPLYVLDLLSK